MKKIIQRENKVLRGIARAVPLSDIGKPKIKKIIREMSLSLAKEPDGVALAAPQIGYPLRIFVVSGKVFMKEKIPTEGRGSATVKAVGKKPGDLVFINPKITKLSREKAWLPEGCLSVRPLYGLTHRAKKATIAAHDEKSRKFTRGASGLLAQIFQHETDHLEGILFTDHAKEIHEELEPRTYEPKT